MRPSLILTALLTLLLVIPFSAAADPPSTLVRVQSAEGRPLIATLERPDGTTYWTDATGQVEVFEEVGNSLSVRRQSTPTSCFTAPPEGAGISLTIPASGTATVTLPYTAPPAGTAALSDKERALLGAVNRKRAELGLQPLSFSGSLGRAAAAISASSRGNWPCGPSPYLTANEQGWPNTSTSSHFQWGSDRPESPYVFWTGSASASQYALNPNFRHAGVALEGTQWSLLLGRECTLSACEVSDERGDAALYDQMLSDTSTDSGGQENTTGTTDTTGTQDGDTCPVTEGVTFLPCNDETEERSGATRVRFVSPTKNAVLRSPSRIKARLSCPATSNLLLSRCFGSLSGEAHKPGRSTVVPLFNLLRNDFSVRQGQAKTVTFTLTRKQVRKIRRRIGRRFQLYLTMTNSESKTSRIFRLP